MRLTTACALVGAALTAGCMSESAPSGGPPGDGQFIVTYAEVPESLSGIASQVRRAGVVDDAAQVLDDRVGLPDDVSIEVRSCTAGTGYDPEDSTIEICLQDVQETRELLGEATADDPGAIERGILTETVMHEAAHALIDQLDLAFTGREEDVADQFSAFMLARDGHGADVLEAVAYGYEVSASAYEDVVSDEHSSDGQRAVNFQCWVHGADIRDSDHLVDADGLTEERAEQCAQEWTDLDEGWVALLSEAGALKPAE